MSEIVYKLKNRRGLAADWLLADPVLSDGEFGIESDTGKIKVGDGVTAWSVLPYLTDHDHDAAYAAIAHDHPEIGGGGGSYPTFKTGLSWRREFVEWPLEMPEPRYLAGCAVIEDDLFIIAGKYNMGIYDDVWKTSDRGSSWVKVNDNAAFGDRHSFGCVALNGDLIVIGGHNGGDPGTFYNDVWKSSDGGVSWSLVGSDFGWGARSGFGCAVHDGSIFLIGGEDGTTLYNDVWKSSDGGASWSLVNGTPGFTVRTAFEIGVFGGSLYVIGGHDGGDPGTAYTDVWKSSNGGVSWTEETDPLPGPRSHYTLIYSDERMLLISGFSGSWSGGAQPQTVWEAYDSGGGLYFYPVFMTPAYYGSTAPEADPRHVFIGRWGAAGGFVDDSFLMFGGNLYQSQTDHVWISEPTIKSANATSIGQIPVDLTGLTDGGILIYSELKCCFITIPMPGTEEPPLN